jgi:hypothetical protein
LKRFLLLPQQDMEREKHFCRKWKSKESLCITLMGKAFKKKKKLACSLSLNTGTDKYT